MSVGVVARLAQAARLSRCLAEQPAEHWQQTFRKNPLWQRYVVERVKERPVTATLAGLGVGLLLGLLLANRSQPR